MRGIAAYMVALGHMPVELLPGPLANLKGAIGVDIFFVISGYIMAMAINPLSQGPYAAKEFYTRRIIRIVPIYIVACFGIALWNKAIFGSRPELLFFFRSLTLFPTVDTNGVLVYPYLAPAWTLTFEMIFYAWIAGLLYFKRYSIKSISAVLLLCATVGYFVKTKNALTATVIASINIEFLFGLWLFELQQKMNSQTFARLGKFLLLFILPVFIFVKNGVAADSDGVYQGMSILLGDLKFQRWFLWGLPAALIVWGLLSFEDWFSRLRLKNILITVGDGSYSLYLLHLPILASLHFFVGLSAPKHLFMVLVAFLLVSTGFYRFIELPIINYLKKRLKRTS